MMNANGIKDFLEDYDYTKGKMLDFGCGDCSISMEVNKLIGTEKNPYCVDIEEWFNYEKKSDKCNFKVTDGKTIDHESESMDIVIALHSLHHVQYLSEIIKEIYRVLKTNGILIIKEHDCVTKDDMMIIDIYHAIYELVLKEKPDKSFFDKYYAKYYSAEGLQKILEDVGFKFVKYKPLYGSVKNYLALYTKPDYKYKTEKYKSKYIESKGGSFKYKHKNENSGKSGTYEVQNDYVKKKAFGENAPIKKLKITNVSVYSVSSYDEAIYTAQRIAVLMSSKDLTVTDLTGNVGGNCFGLAQIFKKVNTVEIDKLTSEMLENNMNVLGVSDKVTVYNEDSTKFYENLTQDVIFIDCERSGVDYKTKEVMSLTLGDYDLVDFSAKLLDKCKLLVLRLPYNYNYNKLIKELKVDTMIIDRLTKFSKTMHCVVYIFTK